MAIDRSSILLRWVFYDIGSIVCGSTVVMMLLTMLTVVEVSDFIAVLRLGLGVANHSESFLLKLVDLFLSELTTSLFRRGR